MKLKYDEEFFCPHQLFINETSLRRTLVLLYVNEQKLRLLLNEIKPINQRLWSCFQIQKPVH